MGNRRESNGLLSMIAWLAMILLLAACNRPGLNAQPSASPTAVPPVLPSASPTAEIVRVYLVISDEAAVGEAARVEDSISALSAAAGYDFIILSDVDENDLEKNVKVAFFLSPDPNLMELVARYPSIQFVAIGLQGLDEAGNLTRIGPDGFRGDQVGFIAGVLAASVTPNWRVGAVSLLNDSEESASNIGFQNGAMFYCGLCRPAYPPFNNYPVGVEASADDLSTVQNSVASLIDLDVDTIYLSPALSDDASAALISDASVNLIGGESPGEELGDLWIATVRAAPEIAIEEIWDQVQSEEGGETIPMPIVIEDINPERLTPGRETWILEILQDLVGGFIDTGVDPATGIAR